MNGYDYVQESGGIKEYRLRSNGLQVLYMQHGVLPVVTFMITYRVGSRNESVGVTGATHFLEHLMFKGTERFNRQKGTSIFSVLQRVGAQVNATTWFDRTNYYEQLPSSEFDLAVSIEADRMRGALLRPEDVEAERTVILNEFDRGENEPLRKLYHEVWSTAFVAHPYSHPTIGWRSDIEQVRDTDLRAFYDTYYHPNNATVSVIGSPDEDVALETVRKYFESIPPSGHAIPEVHTVEPPQRGEKRTEVRMAGEMGSVMVAYKTGRRTDPASVSLDVLATVLTDGKNSRLYRALVDEGLASSVSASCSALRDPGLFYVYASCLPGVSHGDLEMAIESELQRVCSDGIPADELRRARTVLQADSAFLRDGSFSIAAQLNEAIASGDWTLYPDFMDQVAAVRSGDILDVAQQTFVQERKTAGYYIPTHGRKHDGQ